MEPCSVPDCVRPRKYRELCGTHYERRRLTGSVERRPRPSRTIPVEERFWQRVEKGPGCWIWTGALDNGYGIVTVDGRRVHAHRVAYELLVGEIPLGLDLDHECHNEDPQCAGGESCAHRRCVRPDHLVPRSRGENVRAGHHPSILAARAGTCTKGHPRNAENAYERKDGKWNCRACAEARR